jgi:hypothetical protein
VVRWNVIGIVSIGLGAITLGVEIARGGYSDHGPAEAIAALGAGMFLFGTMTLYTQALLRKVCAVNRPADEAYMDGHGVGFDKGWRECARKQITGVHPLSDRRQRNSAG